MARRFVTSRHLFACWLAAGCLCVVASARSETFADAVTDGTPLIDIRLRHEAVDESDKAKDAAATTIRARLGYRTGQLEGFSGIVEFDFLQHLDAERFNDSINGRSSYPMIADPDMAALNRLQIDYAGHLLAAPGAPADFKLTLGRQEIIYGDLRFIGNSGWRQHEQTFDAVSVSDGLFPNATLTYAYVSRVNRPTGPQSPSGYFDSDSHLVNAIYDGVPGVTFEAYLFLLDFKQAPALSSASYGVRAQGSYKLGGGMIANFGGALSRQRDYGRNPFAFELGDYRADGGLSYGGFSGLAGYEILEGNGTVGFQTPLGTGHQFQGWAETFTNKPSDGVKDFYMKAAYEFAASPLFAKIMPAIAYHDFAAQHVRADYGSEWDAMLEAQIDQRLTLDAAYADYRGAGPFPDKRVLWTYATYRY